MSTKNLSNQPAEQSTATLPVSAKAQALRQYLRASTSDNTQKTYRSALRQFEKWGGRLPCEAHNVVDYLLDRAPEVNPRTLDLHLTAISQWHYHQRFNDPVRDPLVRKTMDGIRRTHGRPKKKAKALRLEHIVTMLQYLQQRPDSKKKKRDIAILLVGFFGAFRRSELVSIQVADLSWEIEGLLIELPESKTDQEGDGLIRALPYGPDAVCPVKALKAWLDAENITEGPIFRPINRWDQVKGNELSPGSINQLLKDLANAYGFEFVSELSSHSFRRGLSTSAARERVEFELIKKQGGWKSDATVWEYIEEGQRLSENVSLTLMDKMTELLDQRSNSVKA